ncbi:hypothetical protein QEJ31_01775 [Pigmentibacter sp. JX0631]|uniref:toxin-antitoxin system YwqK family antitoxin n=1 Tax=Pigmentibacter sp. JX0631 TaxID=2976982 RepID=UPI002468A894|nr:hypothetical protein [Pigmentibacter sp. JX0631]WGL60331.1 hypothetical protein QEJ31_01775 [Pigmentibacter sp. JX0631]
MTSTDSNLEIKDYYENGNLKSICLKNDLGLNGEYKIYHKNGKEKQISYYLNGLLHGRTTIWDEFGNILYEMDFLANKLNGPFIVYSQGIKNICMLYINGVLNGKYEVYSSNGNLIQSSTYFNNLLEGESKYFNETANTLIKQEFYKKGKLSGIVTTFYPNQTKMLEQEYLDGTLNGFSKFYSLDGSITEYKAYENGKVIYQKNFDSAGKEISNSKSPTVKLSFASKIFGKLLNYKI